MCGAIYNVNDHPALPGLLSELGYSPEEIERITDVVLSPKRELRPTDPVLSLVPTKQGPAVMSAIWWLALDRQSLKPDTRWTTFNCQSRHLLTSKMHRIPPRSHRSVVFARGFFEWQPLYFGGRLFSALSPQERRKPPKPIAKQRYLVHRPGEVMLLAALCKHWLTPDGQPLVSTGTITLPPHPDFLDIHHKSFPLVLNRDELDAWLDPGIPLEAFESWFQLTRYRQPLEALPVDDARFEPVGEAIRLTP